MIVLTPKRGSPILGTRPATQSRVALILILASVAVLWSACSRTGLAYNLSEWFILHRIDHYFDLTSEQEAFLEPRIEQLKNWHRRNELPRLVKALEELQVRYRNGLDGEDMDWIEETHIELWRRFLARGLPDFSEFLGTVSEDQIARAENGMTENLEFLVKQNQMAAPELREEILHWLYDFLEEWYGSLEDRQKDQIQQWVKEDPEWIALKLKNRQDFQKRFAAIVRESSNEEVRRQALSSLILQPRTYWSPDFGARFEAKKREWKEIFLQVDGIMQPDQRRRVLERIQGYTQDFRDLMDPEFEKMT